MKKYILIIFIVLVFIIVISFVVFRPYGNGNFHESFVMKFDPYKMCLPSVLSSALANEAYNVQQYTTSNEGAVLWELRIPALAEERKIITNISILTYSEMPERESISYSITWERPRWTRKRINTYLNEDQWEYKAYQAEFICNFEIATQNVGTYELNVYGNSIDECILEAEDILMKLYYDLTENED